MTNSLYLIKNELDISKEVSKLISKLTSSNVIKFNYNKPIIIFNIQKTTFDEKGYLNKDIYCAVKHSIKNGNNVLFFSYDTNEKLIKNNYSILNSFKLFKNIPKIFLKTNKIRFIIEEIYKEISKSQKYKKKIILIDNNPNDIEDINTSNNKKIIAFHYLKYNDNINDTDKIKNKKELYKLLKIKIPRKTKKQIRYNEILQNNIKKNMSLFKKGKYKSKKQAIAIAYQETTHNKNFKC